MEVFGVQAMKMKRQNRRCSNKKGVKVVYISSPMKVSTCASKFRALVQELTGKDSDAASRFPDPYAFEKTPKLPHHHHHHRHQEEPIGERSGRDHQYLMMSESPTFSDGTRETTDEDDYDVFRSHGEGSFLGMFGSNLFTEPFQFDHAFKSFDGSI